MSKLIYIALGSAIGGVARFLLSKAIDKCFLSSFPWGTFAVNVTGCLIIGLLYGLIDKGNMTSENLRLFLTVGFCGGFTTFSTFAHENYLLFGGGNIMTVAIYASASFFFGILMAYLGHAIVRFI